MILKIISKNNVINHIQADIFTTQIRNVSETYKKFKLNHEPSDPVGGYIEECNKRNSMCLAVKDIFKLGIKPVSIYIDGDYDEAESLIYIDWKSKDKEYNAIVTNSKAYLMSDEGKTIERLM